ncbi:hypothetical protein HOY82DRAFT_597561 [Tuber indicum]|nr:hypothetical protein HOY82DRAFT_597561 [Tuber indicum]
MVAELFLEYPNSVRKQRQRELISPARSTSNAPDVGVVWAGCTYPGSSSIESTKNSVAAKELSKKGGNHGVRSSRFRQQIFHFGKKRAKTDEDKEQRRIEPVLRNCPDAQSSRERKQKDVETLEEGRSRLAESNAAARVRVAVVEESHKSFSEQLGEMEKTLKRY